MPRESTRESLSSTPAGRLARRLGDASDGPRAELAARAMRGDARVEPALSGALQSVRSQDRVVACDLYALLAHVRDVTPLLRALDDGEATVRAAALAALARHGHGSRAVLLALYRAVADTEPRVSLRALAALTVVAPSMPVIGPLARRLVVDRDGHAADARLLLRFATDATVLASAPGLGAREPLDRRGVLDVLHATQRPLDPVAARLIASCEPGTDTYVRRAAARALGHLAQPARATVSALTRATRDWDPGLRVVAAVSLGQLATRRGSVLEPYARALGAVDDDEFPELAAALRASPHARLPHAPLLAALLRAHGFARLDLADAVLQPYLAHPLTRGVWSAGVRVPGDGRRIDDAVDSSDAHTRTAMAQRMLALAQHECAAVRATALLFAAHGGVAVGVAMVATSLAHGDPDEGVRALARSVLDAAR